MTWFKIDDGFYDHPKVVELDPAAVGLWALAGTYCARHLTDGLVTAATARRLGGDEKIVGELVAARLWLVVEADGKTAYQFKDWAEYQPTRDAVLAEREAGKQRAAASRARRLGERSPSGSPARSPEQGQNVRQTEGVQNTEVTTTVHPTRPDPTRPDHVEEPPVPAAPKLDVVKMFDEVYAVWPKKRDRKEALDRFRTALKKFKGREDELVKAIKAHAAAHEKYTETRFVRALGVWLNKESWDNPLATADDSNPTGPAQRPAPRVEPDWMNAPRRVDPRERGL